MNTTATNRDDLVTVKPATPVEAGEPIPSRTIADMLEEDITEILALLVAAPSFQLNQTHIARRMGRRALSIGLPLTAMVRRGLIECPIKNPNLERPSARTYRLTAETIAANPRK